MGTIYIDGQFKSSAKPVSGVDPNTLKNYTTKEELQKAVDDVIASIEGIDHDVVEETLIIQ